jgi:hypothetical protein
MRWLNFEMMKWKEKIGGVGIFEVAKTPFLVLESKESSHTTEPSRLLQNRFF